jgi:hypothetical protein
MKDQIKKLAHLGKVIDMDLFYSITLRPSGEEISLQGRMSSSTLKKLTDLGFEFSTNEYGYLENTNDKAQHKTNKDLNVIVIITLT